MKVLITGVAGFIGMHLANRLFRDDVKIIGIDNMNDYYDVDLKKARLEQISHNEKFRFELLDLLDLRLLKDLFKKEKFDYVINLAAQAGVRYSIEQPQKYVDSNITGFLNILECCRHYPVNHLVFASSSSVYGLNNSMPFSEKDHTDHPISLYGATKKANELMAHSYSNLFSIPSTGLRFFTVYGPWGRPDMAPFIFIKSILSGTPIKLFNNANMERDFTYIDDISEAVTKCCYKKATSSESFNNESPENAISFAPHRIFNIGNSKSINLLYFIETIEKELGKKAKKIYEPIQAGDVLSTYSDTNRLEKWIEYKPKTSIEKGVKLFIDWYKKYYAC